MGCEIELRRGNAANIHYIQTTLRETVRQRVSERLAGVTAVTANGETLADGDIVVVRAGCTPSSAES